MRTNLNVIFSVLVYIPLALLYEFWPSLLLNKEDIGGCFKGSLQDAMFGMYGAVTVVLCRISFSEKPGRAGTIINLIFVLLLLTFKCYYFSRNGLTSKPYIFITGAIFNFIIAIIAVVELINSRGIVMK